jgi:hypothetical protein
MEIRLSSVGAPRSFARLFRMIYSLSLETALLLTGLVLIVVHLLALGTREKLRTELKTFPRSSFWGSVLIFAVTVWALWLISTIDLGEFSNWRMRLKVIVPVAGILAWRYVPEFLAVRALGMLVLLAAEPLLEAAWLRPETSRLLLVVLVYAWVSFALFWIGMPYTLRDQIDWLLRTPARWKYGCYAGVACGAVLLISRWTLHR